MTFVRCGAVALAAVCVLPASEFHGVVKYGGLPVPGATVIATQGDKKLSAVAGDNGVWSFADLADGKWTFRTEMLCFAPLTQDATVGAGAPGLDQELALLSFDEIKASAPAAPPPVETSSIVPPTAAPAPASKAATSKGKVAKGKAPLPPANTPSGFQRASLNASATPPPADTTAAPATGEASQSASDSFAISGSQNNGAVSPFAQSGAFGNNRRGPGSLYNGSVGLVLDNSALDARPFSITGQDTPKAAFNHLQGVITLGGPVRIPHLIRTSSQLNFFVGYQVSRNRNGSTQSALLPTADERNGIFTQPVLDPSTNLPFAGNVVPQSRISQQARTLLKLYPLPNFAGDSRYNFQIPLTGRTDQDSLQSRLTKSIGRFNQVFGAFAFQSVRSDTPSLFGFHDKSGIFGMDMTANWSHRFTQRVFNLAKVQYTRQSTRITPYFANRENISGEAGIFGNDQTPLNWGPPALAFSNGLAGVSDAQQSFNRNQTMAFSDTLSWIHAPHNLSIGGDYKRQQFNYLSQQDARGSFTFNGAATGSAFADFLIGTPDTSSIAFGNADKYFRSPLYDAFVVDEWRVSPSLTLNVGVRWEYAAPIAELYGRLVNLDIAPGFSAEAPVIGYSPTGSLTRQSYPSSLVHPDKHAFQPRLAAAWRPISGSSMVVRASYGVAYNTSVYQSIALQMAQQSPLSKSLSVQNSLLNPLSLANGFNATPGITPNTFAIDPDFRIGYVQTWTASVQRDLPASLVMIATYLGNKGTRAPQEFLPNTYPVGAVNPCPSCPTGFAYMTSNGNSTRESGTMQLRRRLHNGITASLEYTYSKSIDDAALGGRSQGGSVIAQNWLNLSGERGLSPFDQRHLLKLTGQYTSGMGLGGGALVGGWRGALLKEWTFVSNITVGSGTPLTPVYLSAVPGTGVTGSIRPDYTGASLYDGAPGLFLNPGAFRAPPPGLWGNAGRDIIIGPSQFTMNASMARTFRLRDRVSMDLRFDSLNVLNHVTYPNWNTLVTSAQFGLPNTANAMRTVQATMRVRF